MISASCLLPVLILTGLCVVGGVRDGRCCVDSPREQRYGEAGAVGAPLGGPGLPHHLATPRMGSV